MLHKTTYRIVPLNKEMIDIGLGADVETELYFDKFIGNILVVRGKVRPYDLSIVQREQVASLDIQTILYVPPGTEFLRIEE